MKQKMISFFTLAALGISFINGINVNAADEQQAGTKDGYDWELWNQYGQGSVSMDVGSNGAFSCSWSNIENCLFCSGKKLGSTKGWSDYGGIVIDYNVDYKPEGNSYMCIYGWTEDPTVEYYIVEAWGTWRPPGQQGGKGTVSSDGKSYDIYTSTRYNQPSIHGTETFEQYWSVNKNNPATSYQQKNLKGTITVSNHFAQWEKCGMRMGRMYEVALSIDCYQSSGSANVKGIILRLGSSASSSSQGDSQQTGDKDDDSLGGNGDVVSPGSNSNGQYDIPTYPRPAFGDIDENGSIELTDLTLLSMYLMGGRNFSTTQMLNADVQYDGIIDIADLALLKQYISKDSRILELGKDYHY